MRFAFLFDGVRPVGRGLRATQLALTAVAAFGIGCRSEADRQAELANGGDPVAALGATVESMRYTTGYWVQQADSNPPLFARARAFCDAQWAGGAGQKVNCAAVAAAAFERSGRRPAPTRPRRDLRRAP